MEPRDFYNDSLDDLIAETLREQMGPPPNNDVWKRIARDLAPPPKRRVLSLRRLLLPFRLALQAPIAQSALALVLLVWVVVQPAYYWMSQEYPARAPIVQPITVPAERVKEQALPASDARPLVELAMEQKPAPTPPVEVRATGQGGVQR